MKVVAPVPGLRTSWFNPRKRRNFMNINSASCWTYKLLYDEYRSKNGTKRQKVKIRNFLLNYLRYQGSSQNMIYTVWNPVKGSFNGHLKIPIQALFDNVSNCHRCEPLNGWVHGTKISVKINVFKFLKSQFNSG